MTTLESQIAYYVSRMPDRVQYRAWWPYYRHQAEQLEKEWPT